MSKLIENFYNIYHQTVAQNSNTDINAILDFEAVKIYDQVLAENQKRFTGKVVNPNRQQRLLDMALAARLTQLLSKTNLLKFGNYEKLKYAIKHWSPKQNATNKSCVRVKQALLIILPMICKKQQLQKLCQEYQEHLKVEIEDYTKSKHEQEYFKCINSRTLLFGAPPVSKHNSVKLISDPRSVVTRIVEKSPQMIKNPSTSLALALQKYRVVNELQKTLTIPIKSALEQITDFRSVFNCRRQIIEKNRDSATIKFLKGIATFLTLGFACTLGIWNVRGEVLTDYIEDVLDFPAKLCHLRTE
jgi:hypothetical protein